MSFPNKCCACNRYLKNNTCNKYHTQVNLNGDYLYKCPIEGCEEYVTHKDPICKNGHTGSICLVKQHYSQCNEAILESGFCTKGHNGIKCNYPNCSEFLVNNICPETQRICIHCKKLIYLDHGICPRIKTKHCIACGLTMKSKYCAAGHDGSRCLLYNIYGLGFTCEEYNVFDKCPKGHCGEFCVKYRYVIVEYGGEEHNVSTCCRTPLIYGRCVICDSGSLTKPAKK